MVNEDLAKMIEGKASRPLMSANLRILVSADSQEKSDNILKEIESAFLQFTEPQGNALNFRSLKGKELDNLFINFLSAFLTKMKPFILTRPRRPRFSISPKAFLPFPSLSMSKPKTLRLRLICPKKEFCWAKTFIGATNH